MNKDNTQQATHNTSASASAEVDPNRRRSVSRYLSRGPVID
jgi:hypothetical protein